MFYLEMRIRRSSLEQLKEDIIYLKARDEYLKEKLTPDKYCTYREYCNRVEIAIRVRDESIKRNEEIGI